MNYEFPHSPEWAQVLQIKALGPIGVSPDRWVWHACWILRPDCAYAAQGTACAPYCLVAMAGTGARNKKAARHESAGRPTDNRGIRARAISARSRACPLALLLIR